MARLATIILFLSLGTLAAGAMPPHRVHIVLIDGMKFVPSEIDIPVGDMIVWKNQDIVPHSVTAETKAFDSKAINIGKSWRYVARKKGRFSYGCVFHPVMKGVLIVK